MTTLLTMSAISKRFGATHALKSVSLAVPAGKVLALIGENGAGKSTLMKVLSGAHAPDTGEMTLSDLPYRPTGPHAARLAGVSMIYQELNLAPHLSIEDNIMLGQERSRFGMLDRSAQRRIVGEALNKLGHGDLRPETPVQALSVGLQQVVEIARALVSNAKVIVFDEPTSSLARDDVQHLFDVIRRLKSEGLGIVYISHFLEEIRELCDCYAVLRDGESVGSGDLGGISNEQIVALMVGRTVDELFPQVPHEPGEIVLKLDRLCGASIPKDVSFDLRRGEILGISGLVGAGRTEMLRCLFGLDETRSGQVTIAASAPSQSPRARIAAGLGFVSEDRKTEGLAQTRSIADNLTLSRLAPYVNYGWLNLSQRRQEVARWMRVMEVKAASQDQFVHELSGGNQQKVAIARVLHQGAEILLLDEPTRGIDVGTKSQIYRLMGQLAAEGKAIIFVSSYLTELLAVCDRVGVMSRGRLKEIRPASEWTEEDIMSVAVSGESSK